MKNFLRKAGPRGFTALELMVATSLTGVFAVSFYTAFHVMQTEMWRNKNYYDNNHSAKNVLDRIAKDTEEAINVVTAYGGNTTGNSCLILKLPSIDAAGAPTSISSQFDYVTYKINPSDSTQLLRSVDVLNGTSQREGGSDITNAVVGRRINSVAFSYAGTGLGSVASATLTTIKYLNVQVTTQGAMMGTTQQTQVDSDLMLRNRIT